MVERRQECVDAPINVTKKRERPLQSALTLPYVAINSTVSSTFFMTSALDLRVAILLKASPSRLISKTSRAQ